MTKQFITLSDEALLETVRFGHKGDLVGVFITVYREFGYDLTSKECPPFRAMDCEIPMAQWTAVCRALQVGSDRFNRTADPMVRVNYMLDWMNKGPSAREEEQ